MGVGSWSGWLSEAVVGLGDGDRAPGAGHRKADACHIFPDPGPLTPDPGFWGRV